MSVVKMEKNMNCKIPDIFELQVREISQEGTEHEVCLECFDIYDSYDDWNNYWVMIGIKISQLMHYGWFVYLIQLVGI